ncbi:MAG: glycosyltransferase family 4 protein, partial [Candidatus Hodarchaeota archaeon]
MKKLNICLVSAAIPPDFQDGASKVFRSIFEYLKSKGHDIIYLTGKWNIKLREQNIKQIDLINQRFLWFPQFIFGAAKYLRSHDFDVIHGNGPKGSFPITLIGKKKKFISTIHDLGPFETKFTTIPLEKFLIKYIANKATYITTVTDFVKKELKYYIPNINPDKIFRIYNVIEEKFKPYPKEAEILKEKLKITGPVLIYIGRIAHYKGVYDIIKAYKISKSLIPNLNLVIGGKPDFSMEKSYQEWKHEYQDIHFVGFISEDEIPIYYTMGDIFITYSYASEGFGLTPLEAMACGTPVICSSILAYKEVIQNNAIFVPAKSPELLAKEIVRV